MTESSSYTKYELTDGWILLRGPLIARPSSDSMSGCPPCWSNGFLIQDKVEVRSEVLIQSEVVIQDGVVIESMVVIQGEAVIQGDSIEIHGEVGIQDEVVA